LIFRKDGTYLVKIDFKEIAYGKIKDDWDFGEAEYIEDDKVEKPQDWDDKPYIYNKTLFE